MGHPSPSNSSPALSISASPSYHLFSTFVIIAWTLFIGATVIVHELAHRMTWDPSRVASGAVIPWAFRPSTGLPNILRIVFSQAHGPITAMHLARLAITAPEVVWASPKTWMEVFWLSDRRWAGPVGLAKTGWTLASRRLRVSLTFCLLAALSIIALATPLVMSNAYPVKTNDVEHQINVPNVTMLDLQMLSAMLNEDQLTIGGDIWSKGLSPPELLPRNAYAETGMQSTASGGAWFFSGGSSKSEMLLTGIRVAGGCEVLPTAAGSDRAFQDRCKTEFGADLSPDSFGKLYIIYMMFRVLKTAFTLQLLSWSATSTQQYCPTKLSATSRLVPTSGVRHLSDANRHQRRFSDSGPRRIIPNRTKRWFVAV